MLERMSEFYSPSAEEYEELRSDLKDQNLESDAPSLSHGLVDLRKDFTEEDERRRDIRRKATGVLAVCGLLLALLQFANEELMGGSGLILLALLLIVSVLLSLANLVPIDYISPPFLRENIQYVREPESEYEAAMYIEYYTAVWHNKQINEDRYTILQWSYYPLVLVILVLVAIIVFSPWVEILREISVL